MKDTLATGAIATSATTAAVAILGKQENGSYTSAINAVSHMVWGEEATHTDRLDARHTLIGAGLNASAVTAWAGLHEMLMPRHGRPSLGRALLGGAATSAIAYVVDYHLVPERFTPGFEKRLSSRSLLGTYGILALSLAVGSMLRNRNR